MNQKAEKSTKRKAEQEDAKEHELGGYGDKTESDGDAGEAEEVYPAAPKDLRGRVKGAIHNINGDRKRWNGKRFVQLCPVNTCEKQIGKGGFCSEHKENTICEAVLSQSSSATCTRRIPLGDKFCKQHQVWKGPQTEKKIDVPNKCTNCKQLYDHTHFVSTQFKRTKYTKTCKGCRKVNVRAKSRLAQWFKAKIQECLKKGCALKIVCNGEVAHEMDHINASDKIFKISSGIGMENKDAFLRELGKCQAVCRACHAIKSRDQVRHSLLDHRYSKTPKIIVNRRRVKRNMQFVMNEKMNRGICETCQKCVSEESCCSFHFDHVDEWVNEKRGDVSRMASRSYSISSIKNEISKCVLVCSDCHAARTQKQLTLSSL